MRYRTGSAVAVLMVAIHLSASVGGAGRNLPVVDGRPVVARVNADSISLSELELQLDPSADSKQLKEGYGRPPDFELLDRLIKMRLIVQEAATMGLSELPDIRKQVDVTSRSILREVLMETLVKDVVPDESSVSGVVKELTREWKTVSLLFPDEESARHAAEEVAGGADYADVAARALAEKRAKTEGDDAYHRRKEYLPEIADAIARLERGQVSPVVRIQAGFVIVKVIDVRQGDDPAARAEARRMVARRQQQAALEHYEQQLREKYVVVKQDVLDSVNYEAGEPGIDGLSKDMRVVAEIKGATAVTVGDLTDYLKMQSFHGGDPVAQGKRMNARKEAALDATLARRVLNFEALRRGLDKSDAYRDRVKGFEDSLVFDAFVRKVIAPDNKMNEAEVRTYYDQHLDAYSYPAMVRLRSLAFTTRGAAEEAIEKLRRGTDYGWLAANAEGQVEPDARALSIPDGQLLTSASLPEGVQKVLADSRAGDFRLYASPDGQFYVLAIQHVVAPNARPYEEVREEIVKKLYGEKLTKGIEDYAVRLRAIAKIAIYLKKAE